MTVDQYPPPEKTNESTGEHFSEKSVLSGLDNGVADEKTAREQGVEVTPDSGDPFAAFGLDGGTYVENPTAEQSAIPEALDRTEEIAADKAKADRREEVQRKLQEGYEAKRLIEKASVSMTIDREAIRSILTDNPDLTPEKENNYFQGERAEEDKAEREARLADLQGTLDTIASLPEKLSIKDGITLILGENGMGKSTLAHAIKLAMEIADSAREQGKNIDDVRKTRLDPNYYSGKGGDAGLPSGLALKIAEHIHIDEMDTWKIGRYLDATMLSGKMHRLRSGSAIEMDLTGINSRSHGQLTREGLLGAIGDDKKRYDRDIEAGRPVREGPSIHFLDEPENGLSPKNHRKLKSRLNEQVVEGSSMIVASNSEIMAFDPDVLRIDLEHPELGVHLPSDHPEIYDLAEFRAQAA